MTEASSPRTPALPFHPFMTISSKRPFTSDAVRLLAISVCVSFSLSHRSFAEEATLFRDSWGVPHAYANTPAAGIYALGYAQAEDRLHDIYLSIRTSVGRLSEVQGEEFLQQDYLMRLAGNDKLHQEYLRTTAPQHIRDALHAFAAGINAYIEDHPGQAGEVAIAVEPWHGLAVSRAMILRWPIGTIMSDLRNSPDKAKPAMGSNQWAVAPARSASGAAILLSDPHLTWEGLAVLYEARVHAGDLHMNGYFLIGSPMLAIGHNQRVGWALTTGGPDTSDVYRIHFRVEPTPQYEYDGEWRALRVESYTIPVKDGEAITRTAYFTHLGPVVSEPDFATGVAYVGASPYLDQTGLYEQFYAMAMGNNVHEVNAALGRHQYNEQNVMSADIDGNIAYVRNGATPIRPSGYDWNRPVDGTTSKTAWQGIHPQQDLVQIYNPPQGYMQNCNISPTNMMVDSPLTADRYPPYIFNVSWDSNNPRGRRTFELLHPNTQVTEQDAIACTLDIHDRLAVTWQRELRAALATGPAREANDPDLKRAASAILAWDGNFTPAATATVLYKFWRLKCGEQCDLSPLGKGQPLDAGTRAQILDLLRLTMDEMIARYGRWDVPWGEVHVVGRGGKYFPVGGADFSSGDKEANFSETLFDVRSTEDPDQAGRYIANSGSMAMILMFFDKTGVRSFTCTPWGQSANPKSPHYMDQGQKLYSQRQMKPSYWTKAELMENLESTKQLPFPGQEADAIRN